MGNLERIKNILKETLVIQVWMCLIYILGYVIDEINLANHGLDWLRIVLGWIIILGVMVIIPIGLTKYYLKSDKKETEKTKRFIFTCIIWIIENTIIGVLNIFIIGGWYALSNMIFIGWIAIVPIVLILIFKLISYIYHKVKR